MFHAAMFSLSNLTYDHAWIHVEIDLQSTQHPSPAEAFASSQLRYHLITIRLLPSILLEFQSCQMCSLPSGLTQSAR